MEIYNEKLKIGRYSAQSDGKVLAKLMLFFKMTTKN